MILKNGKLVFGSYLLSGNYNIYMLGEYYSNVRKLDGTYCSSSIAINTPAINLSDIGFLFGTGTTAPTIDDYCMETEITSSNFIINKTKVNGIEANTGSPYMLVNAVIVRGSGHETETFTINEIGLLFRDTILIDRTVLSTPVVLNDNNPQATVSIKIKLS